MGSMQTKIVTTGAITAQTATLVPLPSLVHQVIRVWAVAFDIQSSDSAASIVQVLAHNVDLGVTLAVADVDSQWLHAEQGRAVDSLTNHIHVPFWPEPYELIGTQRWICLPSNGTVVSVMTVYYTTRREPNLTTWSLLKRRTSFEED